VLVTGATGFAGSHLLELVARLHTPVVATSRRRPEPSWRHRSPHIEWRHLDVLDRDAVRATIAEVRPAVVYHLAGAAAVGSSWRHVTRTYAINLMGTHHLLDALRQAGDEARVLIPGSAHVYRLSTSPIDEAGDVHPDSPYALSKLAQELRALQPGDRDAVQVLVTRSFNHVGPRQDPSFVGSSFARQIALIEAGRAEPDLHVGNLDAIRDFTDVRDTVRAYAMLIERGRPGTLYNVCSGHGRTVRELLDELVTLSTAQVRVTVDPSRLRPSDMSTLVGDFGRLRADTGWAPTIPFSQTMHDLLAYWRTTIAAS